MIRGREKAVNTGARRTGAPGVFPKKERRKGDHSLISFSRFWMNPLRIAT